jgi:hypothetical protein
MGCYEKFSFESLSEIPRLSWLAIVTNSPIVRVLHGNSVETTDSFFIEGAWSGDFSAGNLSESDCLFGSGGQLKDGVLTLVSSIATTDYLYIYDKKGSYFFSNSLPTLLWWVKDELNPLESEYSTINESVLLGIRNYRPLLPTKNGAVKRIIHFNAEIGDGRLSMVEKPLPPHFASYGDYHDYLRSSCVNLIRNARDVRRAHALKVFSTQSKGYDSTAFNVLVHDCGLDGVFTITQGKGAKAFANLDADSQYDDDGSQICQILGLNVIPLNRRQFESQIENETAYWAGMHRNGDMNFVGLHKHIVPPAILLTGTLGELWYPTRLSRPGTINDELVRWDLSCHGLSEIRLDVGYVQVAVPYIGARRRIDITKISDSAEMMPWALQNKYDRPIPRRIAEEGGVPRALFGQRKTGSVVDFPPPDVPYGRELRREFFSFLKSNGILGILDSPCFRWCINTTNSLPLSRLAITAWPTIWTE